MTTELPIRGRALCYAFDGPDVLHDIDIDIPAGSVTGIVGANGSGKSTLVELLAGVRRPRAGRVERVADVALVVQRIRIPETLPMTVRETVMMGTWGARHPRREAREAANAALDSVGLAGFARRSIHALSGGQRQRVLLAQGIARDAGVLILDEPAAGLDAASRQTVRNILGREAARGRAIAWVTHDDSDIASADRIVHLVEGRRVA